MSMPNFVRYNDDEWSALYQDGELVVIGDSYLADSYIANYLKVRTFTQTISLWGFHRTVPLRLFKRLKTTGSAFSKKNLMRSESPKDQEIAELEVKLSELKRKLFNGRVLWLND